MATRRPCALTLTVCICVLLSDVLQGQGPVTYVYDGIGRLVGVIDGSGESAVYVYDAVGNLLSIERHTAGTVSIIQFTPGAGPVATSVTIHGTSFSATPAQNTVTFNGTGATVTSSTTNQIVATVPAGATSGTIAVTAPSGSATSSSPFTVAASNAPTITSVTPGVGASGTAVTIAGTIAREVRHLGRPRQLVGRHCTNVGVSVAVRQLLAGDRRAAAGSRVPQGRSVLR